MAPAAERCPAERCQRNAPAAAAAAKRCHILEAASSRADVA
jgi:hypothetical protein